MTRRKRVETESHPMVISWNLWKRTIEATGASVSLAELHAYQAGWQAAVNQFATFGNAQATRSQADDEAPRLL